MSTAGKRTDRWASLDTLRGLGALLVVFHHFALSFFPHTVFGASQRQNAAWESALHTFPGSLLVAGRFAVELFFVLSGFVLSRRFLGERALGDRELAAAVVKRCFRLLPMVWLGIGMVVIASWLGLLHSAAAGAATGSTIWLQPKPEGSVRPLQVALSLLVSPFTRGAQYDSALWTIGYEMVGSLLVFGLVFVARRTPWRWGIYALTAGWLHSESTLPFIAGLVLADLHASFPRFSTWAARSWVAAPVLLGALYLGGYPFAQDEAGRQHWSAWVPQLARLRSGVLVIGAVLVVATVLGNPRLQSLLDCRPGRYLGRISYALYAMHEPVLLTLGCGVYLGLTPQWAHTPAAFTAGAAMLVVSFILAEGGTRWVDLPSQRFANWIAKQYLASLGPAEPASRPHNPPPV